MKILGGHLQQIAGAYLKASRKPGPAQSTQPTQTDEVNVSERAGDILKARQAYDRLPEVRESRVSEIRQQIQKGTYKPSDEKTSQAMILGVVKDKLIGKDDGKSNA